MPLLNPAPKQKLLQTQMKFILELFIELDFSAEDALALLQKMFHKSNIASLSVREATTLVDSLHTIKLFKSAGLRTFNKASVRSVQNVQSVA